MTNYQIIEACQRHDSTGVGVMIECAMDNAGFDGADWTVLREEACAEIVRHLDGIVNGRMLDYATDADYAAVAAMLRTR